MESGQSFSDKPRTARKLYEYCDAAQLLNTDKSLDDLSSSVKVVSIDDSDYFTTYDDFQFPPPPHHQDLSNSLKMCSDSKNISSSSSDDVDTNSDSSHSDCYPLMPKTQSSRSNALYSKFKGYLSDGSPVSNILNMLPPIGVFWDIENCQVPKGRSAVVIAQAIRDKFFHGYRETEFLVVCDVKKENAQVIQELNDAQVNLIHVSSQSKNAADDKLRQAMRRFADIHGPPAAIMLISGDINFSSDLCDLRHRKKIHVILLHNDLCSQSLILCANENHNYSKLVETLPLRGSESFQSNPVEVLVTNLPIGFDPAKIRNKLKRLSENCGGRVGIITDTTTTIRFSSMEYAARAQKRMNRERVFGNAVFVSTPYNVIEDQEMQNSGMKVNLWKSFDNGSQNKDKMFQYQCNGNKIFQPNGNMLTNGDLNMNGFRNDMRTRNYPNGYLNNNCRNGRGSLYPNVNQENINSNCVHWNNHKQVNENGLKGPRQVLAVYNANTNCISSEQVNVNAGKPEFLPFTGQTQMPYYKPPFPNQPHVTPPVTILKRHVPVDPMEANKRYFHPISTNQPTSNQPNQSNAVELHITNLDQSMDPMELRRCLNKAFGELTQILHLSVFAQTDGNYAALIKVPSQQDAQFVISKLHHKVKIGFKRIAISHAHSSAPHNIALIRSQTLALLLEVPGHKLPYFKFRELCEKRFKISPSLSDLHKIRDVCTVTDEASPTGRCINLLPEYRNSPSPLLVNGREQASPVEHQYCLKHWTQAKLNDDTGWAELEASSLPNVTIKLDELTKSVHELIISHNKYLLLASFCNCYEAECGQLTYDDNGVPLEHLVTCVSGVELVTNPGTGIKYLTTSSKNVFDDKKSDGSQSLSDSNTCISPSLANNLALFSRELVDLLKTFKHCMMPFNRFIPAYHHHFGRQCRVADYGYTKLIDLMEALPNVVQVIGDGNRRVMTLAHRAQVRRFTSDLLRVLKSLASKQATISEFPSLFEKTLGRTFNPIDYGLCHLEDLLSQVSENTVVISSAKVNIDDEEDVDTNPQNMMIAIPKREQTAEEIERTKGFAKEVIELLSHAPQCSMLFNKFIPAYHHHYGHQCKVSDFGFTKLIELFEAIPDVVKIEDDPDGGDRRVTLKEDVKLKVLGEQLASLIMAYRSNPSNDLSIDALRSAFSGQYGYSLKPNVYGFKTMEELIRNLDFAIRVVETPAGIKLQAVDKNQQKFLSLKTKRVLIERTTTSQMLFRDFARCFADMFNEVIELETLEKELTNVVTIVKNKSDDAAIIKLTPIELFARDVYFMLKMCDGKLPLNSFENAYLRMYGTAVQPASYGYQTCQALLQAIPQTVVLRGQPPKRMISINVELASVGFVLPKALTSTCSYLQPKSPRDINQPAGRRIVRDSKCRPEASSIRTPIKDNHNEQIPPIILPELTLHPDIYTASPLTSPSKALRNTIMFSLSEHVLHAPFSSIEAPASGQVPHPTFLMENRNQMFPQAASMLERQYRARLPVVNHTMSAMEKANCEMNAYASNDEERHISASVESSTDSFSDGTASSTNKRRTRLAAHFQGYAEMNNQ